MGQRFVESRSSEGFTSLGALAGVALIPDLSWGHGLRLESSGAASPAVGIAVFTIVACMVAAPICMFIMLVWSERRRRRMARREGEEQAEDSQERRIAFTGGSPAQDDHHRAVH